MDTCGLCPGQSSAFDTVLSAYTGPCNNLTQIACNDDAGSACGLQSQITFAGTAGVTYHIRVAGYLNASGPFRLNLSAPTAPPPNDDCANAIPVQTGSPAACGTTSCATPSPAGSIPVPCGASLNSPDVWYAWTPPCSGQATIDTCGACPGQTGLFDTVLSVYWGGCGSLIQIACNDDALGACGLQSRVTFLATAGVTYRIRVAGFGSPRSGNFRLNIAQTLVPPPNDACATATTLGPGGLAPFHTCGATTDGPSQSGCQPSSDVWFRYVAPCSGQVRVDTCGASFDTVLSVYGGSCGALTLLGCNDNATSGPCAGSTQSALTFNATAGIGYLIRVGGAGSAQGWGLLRVTGPDPVAPLCPPAVGHLYCRLFQVQGTANNTPWAWSIRQPCCFNFGEANVPGLPVGSSPDALAAAFANSINNACTGGGVLAFAVPSSVAGRPGLFVVCVKTCSTPATPWTLSVGPAGTDPANQCIVADIGTPAWPPTPLPTIGPCSFNPPLTELPYADADLNQNGVDDAIDLMNGTSADLNQNGVPDEAESCQAPQILAKPDSQVVTLGTNVTLSVTAAGSAPLSYQWSRNGVPLAGATTATLTIQHPYPADLGDYTVTVSNVCGTTTAGPATLSVESSAPVAPMLTLVEFLPGHFRLSLATKAGWNYLIEYKDSWDDQSWTPLTTLVGDGTEQQVVEMPPLPNLRFYRAQVLGQ